MDKADLRLRKKWLILAFVAYVVGPWLSTLAQGLVDERRSLGSSIAFSFVPVMLGLLLLAIAYRCAYEKPGTKMLMFLAIMGMLGCCRSVTEMTVHPFSVWLLCVCVAFECLSIWFVVLTFKFRDLNKRLQREGIACAGTEPPAEA